MSNKIYPCLWFDGNAKKAAEFYTSLFSNAKITTDTPMVVKFEIEGQTIMGLNGGPMFKINPSISFFVTCASDEEIEKLWAAFSDGGTALMALNKYPWSEKYGWICDRFGMTWQLMLGQTPSDGQKLTPSFLFSNEQFGKGQDAIKEYTALFPDSTLKHLQLYKEGGPQPAGYLEFGQFVLCGQNFIAMDGPGNHDFKFSEGVSLVVECDTQEEIDKYWNSLTMGGEESRCGWLKDKYGVSWQIVPQILNKLMSNPAKGQKVMTEVLKMKKLEISPLIEAAELA